MAKVDARMSCEKIMYRTRDGLESGIEEWCTGVDLRPGDILTKPVKPKSAFITPDNPVPPEYRNYRVAKIVTLSILEEV